MKRVLEALEAALLEDGELLNAAEREEIDQAASALKESCQSTEPRVIKRAIAELDKVATEFVARRMDGSIKKALAGHNVDEF